MTAHGWRPCAEAGISAVETANAVVQYGIIEGSGGNGVLDEANGAGRYVAPGGSRLIPESGFGSNPGKLRMYKFLPARLPAGAPLVVILHGCGQTAAEYDRGTGWSSLAEAWGFALLAPEQRRENNRNTCFSWFNPADTQRDRGEAASIRQMVGHMLDTCQLDPARVFITGLSAGGAMTAAMLAAYPDLFAAGGIIGGLPYTAASGVSQALFVMRYGRSRSAAAWGDRVRGAADWQGPWPRVSIWTGGADTVVVPANAEELVKQWTDVHGIRHRPVTDRIAGYPRHVYRDAEGRPVVEFYEITGMAHGVPIDPGPGPDQGGVAGPFMFSVGISSTVQIARFFGLGPVPSAGRLERFTVKAKWRVLPVEDVRVPPTVREPVSVVPPSGLLGRLRHAAGHLLRRVTNWLRG